MKQIRLQKLANEQNQIKKIREEQKINESATLLHLSLVNRPIDRAEKIKSRNVNKILFVIDISFFLPFLKLKSVEIRAIISQMGFFAVLKKPYKECIFGMVMKPTLKLWWRTVAKVPTQSGLLI